MTKEELVAFVASITPTHHLRQEEFIYDSKGSLSSYCSTLIATGTAAELGIYERTFESGNAFYKRTVIKGIPR